MAKKHTPEEAEAAKERRRARDREHYHTVRKHSERYKEIIRKSHRKQKTAGVTVGHGTFLKYQYGITAQDKSDMIAAQKGCCAICLKPFEDTPRGVACVDHCHTTGEIRAILCDSCNKLLGYAKDNTTILRNAIRYLELFEEEV